MYNTQAFLDFRRGFVCRADLFATLIIDIHCHCALFCQVILGLCFVYLCLADYFVQGHKSLFVLELEGMTQKEPQQSAQKVAFTPVESGNSHFLCDIIWVSHPILTRFKEIFQRREGNFLLTRANNGRQVAPDTPDTEARHQHLGASNMSQLEGGDERVPTVTTRGVRWASDRGDPFQAPRHKFPFHILVGELLLLQLLDETNLFLARGFVPLRADPAMELQ
mmetsp:Transcript_1133/g.1859  ORF Transcript_1133/g.1859 Transcript_1133/m.1859 type:complete len:222 (+) Transcript_1133:5399-6064(+)